MFRLSKKSEYALRAVLYLSREKGVCTTSDIAKHQEVPKAFLKKIIQYLSVAGLIISVKGKNGGVKLNVSPEKLTVREVIEKIEGPLFLNDCLIHEGACKRDKVCPLHEMWKKGQEALLDVLGSHNFKELAERNLELLGSQKTGDGLPENSSEKSKDVLSLVR